ncbi:MAG: AAA family ATPase [Calditrichia bacterium]
MIKKIKRIKNLDLFSDYTWDNNLSDFSRYNLIYGWNGTGKTTLSKLFAYLEEGSLNEFPHLEYEIEHEDGNYNTHKSFDCKVRVFNQDYIQRNVQLVDGVASPIFILGEENKEIANQILSDEKVLFSLQTEQVSLIEDREKIIKEKKKIFTDVAKVIGANLVGFSTRNYRAPNAVKDFDALPECEILSEEIVAKKQAIIKQEQKDNISKIELDEDANVSDICNEIKAICGETVEINVIAKLTGNQTISEWVEQGLSFHTPNSKECEFCGSNIPQGRIETLLGHFNEADKKLKEKIDSKIVVLREAIQKVNDIQFPNKAQFNNDLQTLFISSAVTYDQEKKNYCAELSSMIEILNTKKQKTTEALPFVESFNNNFEASVNSINNLIDQHNQTNDNFQSEKDKAIESLKQHYLSEVFEDVKAIDAKLEELNQNIIKLENGDSTDYFIGILNLRKRIATNKSKISSAHKACDKINEQLKTFLGRSEILFEVSPEGGYVVKRNGVVANNLSEGEKTAIAFVYFVVHLNDQDFDIDNGIVVIDDPISSLDSNSLFQAFAFLKKSVKDAKQIFIFTHNFSFLKLLLNWLNRTRGHKYFMINNKHSATGNREAFIAALDKELRSHESEYHYLFKVLYTFKKDGNENISSVYHLPNIARKVLDTFLMFRVPTGESPYKKLEKLTFDEVKKTAIYKFTNDQSHITGDGFDPSLVPETQKNVEYLLEMMETVFPEHYKILEEQFSD